MKNKKLNIVLFVLWIALMMYGILSPANLLPKSIGFFSFIPFFDKIVHSGMFAGFSFLLFWLVADNHNLHKSVLITFIVSISFGLITELAQLLLSEITFRGFEWMDLLADTLGVVLSMVLCYIIFIRQQANKRKTHHKQKIIR
ncbi:MAG: VanZ family protein [Bacteroidales bacterium]|nr:VanZ family protein [Bacteroidales bacterium]MDD4685355.1 VanZ family protein [Bacteroidales bacterium]